MRITRSRLRWLIREELKRVLIAEQDTPKAEVDAKKVMSKSSGATVVKTTDVATGEETEKSFPDERKADEYIESQKKDEPATAVVQEPS